MLMGGLHDAGPTRYVPSPIEVLTVVRRDPAQAYSESSQSSGLPPVLGRRSASTLAAVSPIPRLLLQPRHLEQVLNALIYCIESPSRVPLDRK
jgi:hypothetical protein